MAVAKSPVGSIPAHAGVNKSSVSPTEEAENEPNHQQAEVVESASDDDGIDDETLKLFEEQKKVPYNRFKEVNDKSKLALRELEDLKKRYQDDLRRERETAEALAMSKMGGRSEKVEYEFVDDTKSSMPRELLDQISSLKREIATVRGESTEHRLKSDIERLNKRYPEADTLAVLGWHKSQPSSNLEDLMELSHTRNVERVETQLKNLLEQKKAKARLAAIPTRGVGIKLSAEDRPKTFKEARNLMSRLVKQGG